MVINDKLKGEFYRTPLTKLASRNNVLTTLNELIDYFNKLSQLIDDNFEKITNTRNAMKVNLLTIYERTKHFKYVLDHFKIDVDSHITERLNDAIDNFQNKITTFVTPYEANLFNHSCVTDDVISNSVDTNSVEDWDRSINMLASELGIRWFGGKISDKSLITELDNILHITKINTYEGCTNEDYINSNLILDIFLYTPKGITWLSLGKNGDFGYNIIVKYQSKESIFNLKLLSETYNNRKEFDINTYDFDMILNTLLSRADIKNGNIYIKVKTNIPSNTESGREGYFLTSSKKFNDYEVKKGISDYSRGLMYHDNKDVAYFEHEDDNIYDIKQKTQGKTETNSILNARSDEVKDFETDSKEKNFYSEISNIGEEKYVQSIYNPDEVKMNELMDIVSGYIISNTDAEVKKNYLEGVKLNKKYDNGDSVNYTKGETVVDISDPSFVGDLSLIAKNENMFSVDNSFSKSKVVPSQFKYGTELSNETVENTFTNDESFTDINDNSYSQDADILLTPIVEQNSIIYKVVKVTDYDILILKSDGIYRFNSRDKLSDDSFTVKINHNNLFNVCYDAIVSGKIVYLATDVGVCKMNTTSFVVERTGVVGGSWCKLFETFDKTNVIAIRKDFSTNLDNGKISYGESVAMTNGGNFNTLKVIFQDNKYFTYDNPALDNELTNNEKSLDYTNKRNFQEEFKVLHNSIENKYYFFRYGHKMLVTDNANDSVMKFANFKIVNAMKDYDISDALIFENKIYFTVYEGGNYYYDLNTNVVHPVEYTTTKIINNRNTTYKSYYMSKLSNLVNDNSDSTGIVDKYQLLTPEELAAGYVEGTKYFYPSIKTLHLCTVEEKMNGPDPNIDYYGCIGTTFGVIGSWFIGKVTSFNNIDKHGVYNPDMNYGYVEFANDGKYLDYTLAVATEGFMMDPSKIHKLVHVEEELPKINCFLKVANGKLFFIPNNPDNEIRNLVYVNGYYYFATNQDYIFKLDEHFNIINQIRSEDCNEIFGAGNLLVIQNNSVTAEEITTAEAYYDKVDGSEMIEGYNPDVEYYLEKEIVENHDVYETLSQEEYDNGPQNDAVYYKKISDTEYEPYTDEELKNPISFTELGPYPLTLDVIDPNKQYASYDNDSGDYILIEASELLDSTIDIADFQEGFGLYEVNPQTFKVEKEEIYKLIEGGGSETRKEMVKASVDNPNDFVLTPKYNAIDSETRAQGIQDNVDYFVSRELPDKEYYDHIEPEAKTLGYDSVSFNPSEYYIGTLVEFSSIPEEEREGKPLYASNSEGTNYVLVDIYRKDVTVIDDINNFYTISDNYRQCTDDDFNFGFEFMKIDKEETPNPVDGVGYYIKLDQPDPNTGIPYADAGIGGETLYAFDITKDYYVPYRLLYHFKNDNTFGYQKTYFHKRIEDSGVEYIKAEKEHGDFKVTDTYTPLTTEEKEEGPQKGVDYYIHPTVMKDVFTKLLDKSSGIQPGVEYYKMNGTPTEVYTPLTTEEINNGPQEGEVYYIFDGGIWVEKPYASLEDGTDNNKIFSEGYVYNKKSYDYSGVEYVLCTGEDFDTITTTNGEPTERGLIPIDTSTYSQPITRESISKIYVNPLPEEGIRYVDDTATITRLPATTFEEYEMQYGRPIYKLVDGEYVPIESGDMVKNEDNGAWYLDPQYTYFSKETISLPYFRESTEEDFDYTGDFENASFKEGRNYRYLNGLEVASGYIERGEKYGMIELYTSDLRVVIYADFYTNGFYQGGYFNESDRDVYYEVDDRLRSQYLGEKFFNKLYQSTDLITYEKATTPNENIFKGLKNFNEWFRYDGTEYISSSTFLDEPHYISLSTLSVSGAYVFDNESYRLVTENDLYEDKVYKLDISKQYYFHELTFENNRYFSKLFEITQNLQPTTTTETTFKDDMDYYTKSQVEEINTNEYVKNQSSGLTTLFNNMCDSKHIVKNIDIYTGREALFVCNRPTNSSIEMYKFDNLQSAPQLLFSYVFDENFNFDNESFLNTNGKLFVFSGGIIIDYLKNEQNTWVPIALGSTYSKDNQAIMVGNNVILSRKITEDGPNKNKYEIYYYDYSTRSLKKTNDIPISSSNIIRGGYNNSGSDRINFPSYYTQNNFNDDIYIIIPNDRYNYTETYIFNKKFIKISGTLNEYTSTNKYSGISYPDVINDSETIVEDWTDKEFAKVYIPNYTNDISFNNIISAVSKTQNENYYGCVQFVFNVIENGRMDADVNPCVSIQYHIDKTNNRLVYDCINEDTKITCCYIEDEKIIFVAQKLKELIIYKYDFETNRLVQLRRISQDSHEEGININLDIFQNYNIVNDIFVINYSRSFNDDNIHFVTLLRNPDNEYDSDDIPLIIDVNFESFDVSASVLSNTYRFPYIETLTNIMVCFDENDNIVRYYDYLTNFSKQLDDKPVLAAEHTDSDRYLLCVKEDDDRLRIYKSVNHTITPTDMYLELEYNETNIFDIATINGDLNNFILQMFTYDMENDEYKIDIITNSQSSFDPDKDYFLKETSYDFFPDIPYFLKSMMVNFKLELEYFTKRIRTIVQDVISHARSYTSTDKTSKLFHKSLIKIKDNSLKVLMNVLTK